MGVPDPGLGVGGDSPEALERERCLSTGLPWPHIDYASWEYMPAGINFLVCLRVGGI